MTSILYVVFTVLILFSGSASSLLLSTLEANSTGELGALVGGGVVAPLALGAGAVFTHHRWVKKIYRKYKYADELKQMTATQVADEYCGVMPGGEEDTKKNVGEAEDLARRIKYMTPEESEDF